MSIDLIAPAHMQRNDHGPLAMTRGTAAQEESGAVDGAPTFASLLSALDSDAGPDLASTTALGADAQPAAAASAAQVGLVPDPAQLLAQGLSRTPFAMQVPAATAPIPPMGSEPTGGGAAAIALPGLDLLAQTSPPEGPLRTAAPASAVAVPAFGAAGGMAGGAGSAAAAPTVATAAILNAPDAALASNGAALRVRLDGVTAAPAGDAIDVPGVAQRRATRVDGGRGASGVDAAPGSGEGARSDWRALLMAQGERVATSPASVSEGATGVFKSLPGLRNAERSASRSGLLALEVAAPGAGAQAGYAPGAVPNAAGTALPDAVPVAGPAAELAQKVHYWITRGTQNAELQLDAFGGKAVDVSISVQGNEALVEFRTDQVDARRALQEAMPQLREMLKSEGLVLAGGFVGTSAQQDPQAQSRRAGAVAAGRTASLAVSPASGPEAPPRRTHGPGREVDVFV